MKVSIITPCYNSVGTIRDSLLSVCNQSYPFIEHIIIDGGSNDGTLDVINTFKDEIDILISEDDQGIYDAMNKGLKYATGDLIGFLNSDDLLASPDCVSSIVQKFMETNADIVYGDNVYVEREDPDKIVRYWKSKPYSRKKFEKGWMPPHLATYIKKELYDTHPHFNTNLKLAADYELMFRFMYKHGARAAYIPEIISKMRLGGVSNQSFRNIMKQSTEVYRSWKINGINISPFIMLRKPLSKIEQYFNTSEVKRKAG